MSPTEQHEVRCCSDSFIGGWSQRRDSCPWTESNAPEMGGCHEDKTFDEAETICADANARLCTAAEMQADCIRSTGCGHDSELIWAGDIPDGGEPAAPPAAPPPALQAPFRFQKYNGPAVSFPLSAAGAATLSTTDAESPVLSTESLVEFPPDWAPAATHADDADPSAFWAEFEDVVDVQLLRRANPLRPASEFMSLPEIMLGYTMTDGAEAVHSEFPNTWPSELVKHLLSRGTRMDPQIVPQRSATDFVNTDVRAVGWP